MRLGEIIEGEITIAVIRERVRVLCIPVRLNGKTIHIDGQAASVRVILPAGLAANVNAEAINAGEIQVSGRSVSAGINPASVHTTLGNPEWPIITLDLQVRVGEIVVEEAAA